jgi:hypothetical protein
LPKGREPYSYEEIFMSEKASLQIK